MRTFILTLAIVSGVLVIPSAHARSSPSSGAAVGVAVLDAHSLEAAQAPQINIDINKGGGGGRGWYANPVWIAIGGLALLLVIVLIVMAARGGGGTTVVKG